MQETVHINRTSQRNYRHFSVPPVATPPAPKKLDFFFVGKRTGVIDSLVKTFESGYAAENTEQAMGLLDRIVSRNLSLPDVILVDGSLGVAAISRFSTFLSAHNKLNRIPVFAEASFMPEADIIRLGNAGIADDIIALQQLTAVALLNKVNSWKKVKERAATGNIVAESPVDEITFAAVAKRIFDIVVSAVLIVMLSPVFLLIMLALRIESKGPVFYISKRAGKGYRVFNFYKFRTMEVEANKKISDVSHLNLYNPLNPNGPLFIKIDNDPRITRLGAFLRKCSLDELPQLLNVLKGDMSLVGNRPLPLYEAASLTTDRWATRFMAPAGMTGLWQIRKNTKHRMTPEERVRLDIKYAEKSNFMFDLWIMAHTPPAVIQRPNA